MKNFINLCLLVSALFLASCEQDPCRDVVCGDNGTCTEGTCICDTGYELNADGQCNTEIRAKFLGQWVVSENCTGSGTSTYTVTSANGTDIMQANIINFWNAFSNPVVLTLTSSNTFVINLQEPDADGFFVESTSAGTIDENGQITLSFDVTERDASGNVLQTSSCTSTWTK